MHLLGPRVAIVSACFFSEANGAVLMNIRCMALLYYRKEEERRRMEGKRVAAATLRCMLIMLSDLQQQVTGFAGLCGCFGDCYHICREGHHPGWFCTVKCMETCTFIVSDKVHDARFSAANCSMICFTTSICGVAQITDGTADSGAITAAACVDDCFEKWSPYKNKHT